MESGPQKTPEEAIESVKKAIASIFAEFDPRERKQPEGTFMRPGSNAARVAYFAALQAITQLKPSEHPRVYLTECIRRLESARQHFEKTEDDEWGYGIATFHAIIEAMLDLKNSGPTRQSP